VLAPAQLEGVWLHSVRFAENENFDESERSGLFYFVNAKVTHDPFEHDEEHDQTWAVARLHATIEWRREDEYEQRYERPIPFELELVVGGAFAWPSSSIDKRVGNAWLEFNARYLLWPYLRSYAASVTSMSRLPPLTIYTLSVPEPPDFESDEDVRVSEEAQQTTE
jgi:hypothetical protein